jgi:hypothetical protein
MAWTVVLQLVVSAAIDGLQLHRFFDGEAERTWDAQ